MIFTTMCTKNKCLSFNFTSYCFPPLYKKINIIGAVESTCTSPTTTPLCSVSTNTEVNDNYKLIVTNYIWIGQCAIVYMLNFSCVLI